MAGKMARTMQDQEMWKRMLERAQKDEAFREALRTDPVDVLVRESGLSPDELRQQIGAMSDDDLDNVAGDNSGGRRQQRWPVEVLRVRIRFRIGVILGALGKLHQVGCRLFSGNDPFPKGNG